MFYEKLMHADNMLILFNIALAEINAICAKYNNASNCNYITVTKDRIFGGPLSTLTVVFPVN